MKRSPAPKVLFVSVTIASLGACVLDLRPPAGARISCATHTDCPTSYACPAQLGLCVPPSDDHQAPSIDFAVVTPARVSAGSELVLTFAASEPLGAPPQAEVAGTAFDCNTAPPYRCTAIVSGAEGEGPQTIALALVDSSGNEALLAASSVDLDFTPPVATALAWRNGVTARPHTAITLDGSVTAPARIVAVSLRSGEVELAQVPAALRATTDPSTLALTATIDLATLALAGNLQLSARLALVDDVGNTTTIESPFLFIDAALPETQIDEAPPVVTSSADATVAFSSAAPDLASFVCRLDDGPFTPCASPVHYSDLAAGTHTFAVAANDAAGNVDATPSTTTWTVKTTWRKIALGLETSCGITSDDRLRCWGLNSQGMLGRGSAIVIDGAPGEVPGRYLDVAVGSSHVCAIARDRSLWCWGSNREGQLGLGLGQLAFVKDSPRRVGSGDDWHAIAAGALHSCGLRGAGANRTLWCWGNNGSAQLGIDPATSARFVPTQIGSDDDWRAIASASNVSCGLRKGGELWCFGANNARRAGQPAGNIVFPPARVGADADWQRVHVGPAITCGVRQSDVYCFGDNGSRLISPAAGVIATPTLVAAGHIAIATSSAHACAVRTNGALDCWGQNENGQLGLGTTSVVAAPQTQVGTLTSWSDVSTGLGTSCAVDADGRAACWGANGAAALGIGTTPTIAPAPIPLQALTDVDVGEAHACGVSLGSILCWGGEAGADTLDNGVYASTDRPAATTVATTIDRVWAGSEASCALTSVGGLSCWGRNDWGQLGRGVTTPTGPGEVLVDTGATPSAASDWLVASVGRRHACGIRKTALDRGTLWCWGADDAQQLGNGVGGDSPFATQVGVAADWTAVVAGDLHTCGLRAEGLARTLWCWGEEHGAHDCSIDGTHVATPQRLGNPSDVWTSVAAGADHGCAIRSDGSLYCWGKDDAGEAGATLPGVVCPMAAIGTGAWQTVAAGGERSCAIAPNGALSCWGSNSYRQVKGALGVGSEEDSVTAPAQVVGGRTWQQVSVGGAGASICGRSGDTAYCWGANAQGALGDGTAYEELPVDVFVP